MTNNTDIQIIPPRLGDVSRVILRHAQIYIGELDYRPEFEAYVIQSVAEFFEAPSPDDRFFMAVRGDALVGAVAVKMRPAQEAQLRFLYVEPDVKGLGVGRRLTQAVVDHSRACGCVAITLDTASDRAEARGLYEAFGFVFVHDEPADWLPDGHVSEHWRLEL